MALDLYKDFATNKTKELEGTVIELGDGAWVRLARWANAEHIKAEEKARAPYRSITASGRKLPKDIAEKTMIAALADGVVLNWGGLKGPDGLEIPYSRENAIKILTDLPDFRDMLIGMASEAEAFRAEEIETDAGNSPAV